MVAATDIDFIGKELGRLADSSSDRERYQFRPQYRKKTSLSQHYIWEYLLNHKCMITITNEHTYAEVTNTKEHIFVLLKPARKADQPWVEKMVGKPGAGILPFGDLLLSAACPATAVGYLRWPVFLIARWARLKKIMAADLGVLARVFLMNYMDVGVFLVIVSPICEFFTYHTFQ